MKGNAVKPLVGGERFGSFRFMEFFPQKLRPVEVLCVDLIFFC
jgi:hypothetical protein